MASLSFDIFARDKASKVFNDVGDSADKMGRRFDGVSKVGLAVGTAVGTAVGGLAVEGIGKLTGAITDGIGAAQRYQTLANQTSSVLKSTGNVAGTSVGHIQALAGSLESMSGVDEELIINSQNVMATFTGIRNEAGKGNDVFDQSTKAALNMSTALGTDLQGATIQVGKALNDPIKGVTALSKVGVSFTQQQRDQIKAMVDSGDTMGAQKLILGELNTEFGGAAKAAGEGFGGSMARAKDSMDDMMRGVGQALMPLLTKMADFFASTVAPAIQTVVKTVMDHWPQISKTIGEVFGLVQQYVQAAWPVVQQVAGVFRDVLGKAIDVVSSIVRDYLIPGFRTIADAVFPAVQKVVQSVTKTMRDHHDIIDGVVGVAKTLGAFFKDILAPALAGVATILGDTLGPAFSGIADVVSTFVLPAIKLILSTFLTVVGGVLQGAVDMFGWVPGVGDKLKGALGKFDKFKDDANAALSGIHDKVVTVTIQQVNAIREDRIGIPTNGAPHGARAAGGPVRAGMPYLVGEHEPEVFVPSQSGDVRSLRNMGGVTRLHPDDIEAIGRASARAVLVGVRQGA